MKFEEWQNKEALKFTFVDFLSMMDSGRRYAKLAWDYQQSRIEELEKEQVDHIEILSNEYYKKYEKLQVENAQLREALKLYVNDFGGKSAHVVLAKSDKKE